MKPVKQPSLDHRSSTLIFIDLSIRIEVCHGEDVEGSRSVRKCSHCGDVQGRHMLRRTDRFTWLHVHVTASAGSG